MYTQHSPKDYAPDGPISIPDMSELFEPLENAIRNQLIPALIGREVSDAERQVHPLRHGVLSLRNPQETTKTEHINSILITAKLTEKIFYQKLSLDCNLSDQ